MHSNYAHRTPHTAHYTFRILAHPLASISTLQFSCIVLSTHSTPVHYYRTVWGVHYNIYSPSSLIQIEAQVGKKPVTRGVNFRPFNRMNVDRWLIMTGLSNIYYNGVFSLWPRVCLQENVVNYYIMYILNWIRIMSYKILNFQSYIWYYIIKY